MSNDRNFDIFTMYCNDKDFSHAIWKKRFLPTSKSKKYYGSNFVVSVSFLIGLALGVPIAFLALHLCDIHQDRTTTVDDVPSSHQNFTSLNNHERIVNVTRTSNQNFFSGISVAKPVVIPKTDIALGPSVKLRSSYNANSNTLLNPMSLQLKDHRPRPMIHSLMSKFYQLSSAKMKSNTNNSVSVDQKSPIVKTILLSQNNQDSSRRPSTKYSSNENKTNTNSTFKLSDIVDGIYWTLQSDNLVPKGFDEFDVNLWRTFLNSTQVLKIEEGCGRMQNRLVTFDGGDKSCCRYRHNNDQIQGEIFSYYLGKILGLKNLLPSALALANPKDHRWFSASSQVALAQWSSERPLVLTKFIENLQPAYIPKHFQVWNKTRLYPIAQDLIAQNLSSLVQWTDLIVFDYLTANLDRTVNNMYNERWNKDMMRQPAHNLAKTPEGLLVFLDNESGLLHGYRLLEKYEYFHKSLLSGLCIFRRDTVKAVRQLHQQNNVGYVLKKTFHDNEPGMADWLPFLPDKNIRILKERIATVYKHMQNCENKFRPTRTAHLASVSDMSHH